MIQHKFLIFETQERFERLLRSGEISVESIAFIKKPLKIWTHNEYWDCSGSVDLAALEQILNSSDFLKQGDALGKINGQVFLQGDSITIETGEGIKYTAGEGIEINGTTINIKPATENTVGGIKLGYPAYGNNRPVQVDGLNRAYVTVPGGGSAGGSKYYENLYCVTENESYPELPTDNDLKGWKTSVDNADGKKIVWMITRLIDGDSIGPWEGPFRISGANGENGVDGDKMEFIYRLSNDGVNKPSLYDINDQSDDYVPMGWTDNPSGINPTNKYEWMSFRTKVHSETDREGTWTRFIDPVLWSAWGKQGLDGDGVEYIFYTSNGSYPTTNPYDWYNDVGYDTREYIRGYNQGTNLPDQWQDDPYDLNQMPQGSKTWVSIRRQTTGTDGEPHWGRYSNPTLWAYYAMDGDAGIGIVADLDNDMMAVSLKSDGTNETFTQTATAKMYNGVSEISTTASIVSVKDMLGNNVPSYSNFVSVNGNTITVTIADGAINFSTVGHINVTVRCTSTINGATVTRDAVLQIIGITFGTGYNYSLKTSCGVIRHAKNGTVSPANIEVWCSKTSGDSPETKWIPSNIAQNSSLEFDNDGRQFKFTYAIDSDSPQDLTTDTISTENISDRLTVNLLYKQGGVWILVDSETIYVVADGVDGLTVPAVAYNILVTKTTLQKNSEGTRFLGDLKYKIQRVEGAETEYISYINSYNVTTELVCGGTTFRPQYIDNSWQWIINTAWSDDKCFSQIIVKEGGVIRASIIIPTIMNGKDGADAEVQALGGKVIRMRVWEEHPDPTYSNGELAQNGVFYEDVVAYGNDLYHCIRSNDGILPTNTTYWEKFLTMSDTSFNTMLAESAYIQNLTAKQIVITNNDNVPVAGVINGTYITSSEGLNEQADNGIRIFAGEIPEGGSVADTAFNVDLDGNVKAGFGKIYFDNSGSGQLANGKISWDSEGNLTVFSLNPLVGGSNFDETDALTNAIVMGRMEWEKESGSSQYDVLSVLGFVVKHGFVLKSFMCRLSVTIPQSDTTHYFTNNTIYSALRNNLLFQGVFNNGDEVAIVPLDPWIKMKVNVGSMSDINGVISDMHKSVDANYTYVYKSTVTWQNVN